MDKHEAMKELDSWIDKTVVDAKEKLELSPGEVAYKLLQAGMKQYFCDLSERR